MKSVLVVGIGRFGRHCARELMSLGHEVMAVDINEKNIDSIANDVSSAQIGDATDPLYMESLGISDFDMCVICIGDNFQASLEATSLCKELGCPFVVARAARDIHRKFLLKMGADQVVYPERQMAIWTATTYSSDHVFDYIQLDMDHAKSLNIDVIQNAYFIKFLVEDVQMTLFYDGRAIIKNTDDINRATSLYSRYIGN